MTKAHTSPDDLLSTAQAGAELGVIDKRVIVLIREGRLPATRVGRAWVIRRGDLEAVRIRVPGRPRKKPEEKKAQASEKKTKRG